MNKILVITFLCAIVTSLKAQNTPWSTTGNIGIGTASPAWPLQVIGEVDADSFRILSSLSDVVNGAPWYGIGQSNGVVAGRGHIVQLAGYYGLNFQTAVGQIVLTADGNIGMGTSNPMSALQIDDGCTKASIGDASGSSLNYGTSYLGFNASRQGNTWLTSGDGQNNGGGIIYSSVFGDMYFAPVANSGGGNQTISDQNVTGNIALHIDRFGKTYAKQIIVQTTAFPDYVFKPTYQLKLLSEVKTYIDQNHHLPDMPSAAEVEKNGLNLGEMNKLLTKKVEELTLYLIEKDNQIKAQQIVNEQAVAKAESLETTLKYQQEDIKQLRKKLDDILLKIK